jgi:hypothetical protein
VTGPEDADDTRGQHFRLGLRSTVFWVATGAVALCVLVAAGLVIGALVGIAGALLAFAVGVGVVWWLATRAAQRDFFRAYSAARGLTWSEGRSPLLPATPLLRKGDDRYAQETLSGSLPGGRDGTLAHYTYEEESTDSKGNRHTTYYRFTIALLDLAGADRFLQRLYCQQRHGFRFLDGVEDAFRSNQRVELESDALDRRYEVFAGAHDDMNGVRQVFEPSFIVWLTESAPEDFGFELEAGALCCNVKNHLKSAAELDAFCRAAAAVAGRVADEAAE